jgi:hypothetical protein
MNDKQLNRSEKIASTMMRTFAIIGIIAVIALIAWLLVQGTRAVPESGSRISAAVSFVTSIFRSEQQEALSFDLFQRTIPTDEVFRIAFRHTDADAEVSSPYLFSYACTDNASLLIEDEDGWFSLPCDTDIELIETSFEVVPQSDVRSAPLSITIRSGELSDTTVLTILNEDIAATTPQTPVAVDPGVTRPVTPTPVPTTPAPGVTRPSLPITPADLAVRIEETGILVPVAGEKTFFPLSPLPIDRNAAVRFTVTNRGGIDSGAWAFVALLPVEGDSTYRYVSPAQASLAAGMQVEFTLGFDNLIDANSGVIRITLVPTDPTDNPTNNEDHVVVMIRE